MPHDTLKFRHSWIEALCMKSERHRGCYGGFKGYICGVFFAGVALPFDNEELAMLNAFVIDSPGA